MQLILLNCTLRLKDLTSYFIIDVFKHILKCAKFTSHYKNSKFFITNNIRFVKATYSLNLLIQSPPYYTYPSR